VKIQGSPFRFAGFHKGDPCEAMAYHGFNGIDQQVVTEIAEWITQGKESKWKRNKRFPSHMIVDFTYGKIFQEPSFIEYQSASFFKPATIERRG
jgi:hypothetical protein